MDMENFGIDENTVFQKVVTIDGNIYDGPFRLVQSKICGNNCSIHVQMLFLTDGNKYVLPLSSVRHMILDDQSYETCDHWKPSLYQPGSCEADS